MVADYGKTVFSSRQGYCTGELTATVTALTNPAQDQAF